MRDNPMRPPGGCRRLDHCRAKITGAFDKTVPALAEHLKAGELGLSRTEHLLQQRIVIDLRFSDDDSIVRRELGLDSLRGISLFVLRVAGRKEQRK